MSHRSLIIKHLTLGSCVRSKLFCNYHRSALKHACINRTRRSGEKEFRQNIRKSESARVLLMKIVKIIINMKYLYWLFHSRILRYMCNIS